MSGKLPENHKTRMRLLPLLLLAAFSAGTLTVSSQAAYIVQPGVVLESDDPKPEIGPGGNLNSEDQTGESGTGTDQTGSAGAAGTEETASDLREQTEGANDETPGAESPAERSGESTEAGAENGESADSSGVIIDPSVTWDFNFDSDETGTSGEEPAAASAEELIALSIASPNTLVATDDAALFYLNGRLIDVTRPSLALTYDDGPQTSVGNKIMDLLAQYGGKCTFFLVGDRVPSRASEVQRMAAEGHEIGNHTYGHVYLNRVGASEIQYQVAACNTVIAETTGSAPSVMRLPGGNKNSTVIANVFMPIILWNVDTRDWETRNSASTVNAVVGKVKDGDIVLMHELYESTAAASETIIPTLAGQGFQLVTVSELAAIKGVTLESGHIYYSF